MINEEATFEKFGYHSTDLMPKSGKKIVAVCDDCGKIRIIKKSKYHALCKSCAQKGAKNQQFGKKGKDSPGWKGGKVMRICEICGTEFPIERWRIKRGRGRFCSPKCMGKWRSEHWKGKNSPTWKGGLVMRICKQCGTKFPVAPCDIKNGRGQFCTTKCMGIWYSKYHRGENHPNWQGGASFEPYCQKFNDEFKEKIRDKFGRTCFLCGKTEQENGKKLSVHHVNGNKNCGCDGDKTCQFAPLCVSCHNKVHSKKIDWEAKIKAMMKNKLSGWYI